MRLRFSTGLALTLCIACSSSPDQSTPAAAGAAVELPQPHAQHPFQAPALPGDTLSVAALSAPGPYQVALLAAGGVVASRIDRTLELDRSGRIVRELGWGGHVAVDSAGNLYIAGDFSDSIDLGGVRYQSAGGLDAFVAKLSPSFELLWSRQFGTSEQERPRAVAVNASDEPILMGTGLGTVALSAEGDTRWTSSIAGSDFAIDAEGALIIAGGFIDALELGPDAYYADQPAVFVAKLDPNGELIYSRSFAGSSEVHVDRIAVGPDQSPVLLGAFRGNVSFGGGSSLSYAGSEPELLGYVLKLDRQGRHLYSRTNDIASTFSAVATALGDVIFTGNQSAQKPLLDLRVIGPDGRERWRKSAPAEIELGTGFGFDLAVTQDELFWSIDAYSAAHSGAVLLPYLVKLAL